MPRSLLRLTLALAVAHLALTIGIAYAALAAGRPAPPPRPQFVVATLPGPVVQVPVSAVREHWIKHQMKLMGYSRGEAEWRADVEFARPEAIVAYAKTIEWADIAPAAVRVGEAEADPDRAWEAAGMYVGN